MPRIGNENYIKTKYISIKLWNNFFYDERPPVSNARRQQLTLSFQIPVSILKIFRPTILNRQISRTPECK